jgi:exopolysaccharide biosynthesis polyprenyl glycosylphosphotransferase
MLNTLKCFDLLVTVLCFLLAMVVVAQNFTSISFEQFLSLRVKISNFLFMVVLLGAWYQTYSAFGLYRSRRFSSLQSEVVDILKASSVGTGLLLLLSVIISISMVDNLFLIAYWSSVSILMIFGRLVLRLVLYRVRLRGRNLRNVVIIGANERALRLARRIKAKPELGYWIMGFIDVPSVTGTGGFKETEYPLLASLNDFRLFLNENPVDEVFICLPMKSYYDEEAQIIALCEKQGVIVRLLSDLFSLKLGRARVDSVDGLAMITITTGAQEGRPIVTKRLLDLVGSVLLLAFLFPVLLATALLIKATSPGPIFFAQERVGLNKRPFRMYKLRTMVWGAERLQKELEHLNEVKGAAFKIRNDPRITPIGKFLRKTSIDELPQLFNVLKGDMSLVGPRPLPVRDYKNFHEDWHRRRFSVRPGITCLWQIGGRSDLDFNKWMELDILYIDHWSLWLDVKILLRTIPVVLQNKGAV